MDKQIIGVQISLQAFNETVRILQELPYRAVADVMVLLRQNKPIYAPDEILVDTPSTNPVESKLPDAASAPADRLEHKPQEIANENR